MHIYFTACDSSFIFNLLFFVWVNWNYIVEIHRIWMYKHSQYINNGCNNCESRYNVGLWGTARLWIRILLSPCQICLHHFDQLLVSGSRPVLSVIIDLLWKSACSPFSLPVCWNWFFFVWLYMYSSSSSIIPRFIRLVEGYNGDFACLHNPLLARVEQLLVSNMLVQTADQSRAASYQCASHYPAY